MEGKKQIHNRGSKYEIPDHAFISLTTANCPASSYITTLLKENAAATEFHFNRDLSCTNYILDYMADGKLHLPKDVCPSKFREELTYWGLADSDLESCCLTKYISFFEDLKFLSVLEKKEEESNNTRETVDFICKGGGWKSWQAKVWRMMEYPNSSVKAKIFAYVSNAFVLLSLFVLVSGTHELFQRTLNEDEWLDYFDADEEEHYLTNNKGNKQHPPHNKSQNNTYMAYDVEFPDNTRVTLDFLQYLKWVTVVYFSAELILKVACFPLPLKHFITFFNVIDVLALAVMYMMLIVQKIDAKEKYKKDSFHDVIEEVQIIRIFRLFRLVKNISGFRVIMLTVRASFTDLMMLLLCLITAVLFFSSMAYFSGDPVFKSIPGASWWAIITLTTVGYGDISPATVLGKMIAAVCAVTGVCLLAILIPVLVNNFLLINSHSVALAKKGTEKKKIIVRSVSSIGPDQSRVSSIVPDKNRVSSIVVDKK